MRYRKESEITVYASAGAPVYVLDDLGNLVLDDSGNPILAESSIPSPVYVLDDLGNQVLDDLGNPILADGSQLTGSLSTIVVTKIRDMQFGHNEADIWRDVPDAVGQAVRTRLLLYRGEWFLDVYEGTPWGGFPLNDLVVQQGRILGAHTQASYDSAIMERVLGTQGVAQILDYASSVNRNTRALSVSMKVRTIYGKDFIINGLSLNSGMI